MHPDGYIELRDRAKDIIISGGENVSTIEVEQVLCATRTCSRPPSSPMPSEKWGERPIAFVTLRDGGELTEAELIAFARESLPGFKAPDAVRFGPLPKTSTGKVKKYELRERARAGATEEVSPVAPGARATSAVRAWFARNIPPGSTIDLISHSRAYRSAPP